MGFASALIAIGLFLLGGAWSIFRADDPVRGRTSGQWVFAGVLLVAAALSIASGVLRF
ncbi:hypothetical protein SAMN03159343_2393 [Klenkia marina]|uniref:Uncharacterized protein n=1 Tax=Klenkia marina TaxID=1960309 RepID=A0A1G4YAC0_9ACTN|nr:hypothetical protein [Klenkia marina]SCX50352.1 hypothetical protein SAMN03159343_2393 [Klenkia marina]